jgi:hypothetical protein
MQNIQRMMEKKSDARDPLFDTPLVKRVLLPNKKNDRRDLTNYISNSWIQSSCLAALLSAQRNHKFVQNLNVYGASISAMA